MNVFDQCVNGDDGALAQCGGGTGVGGRGRARHYAASYSGDEVGRALCGGRAGT